MQRIHFSKYFLADLLTLGVGISILSSSVLEMSKSNLQSFLKFILREMSDVTGHLTPQLSPKARERQFIQF